MCKLFAVTGKTNKQTVQRLLFATNAMYSKTQKDGFGFVAIGGPERGGRAVASGRYPSPNTFMGFGVKGIPEFLRAEGEEVGELPETTSVLIAHGRTSTNRVCAANVHPFRNDNLWLAHNGQVDWLGPVKDEPPSTAGCDSEQFLNWLASGGSWADTHQLWGGWGVMFVADAALAQMCVAVDTQRIHCAKRQHGKGWVFATDDDDLVWICRQAGVRLATRPIKVPNRLVYLDSDGAIASDAPWDGFATRTAPNTMFAHQNGAGEVTIYRHGKKWKPGKDGQPDTAIPEYKPHEYRGPGGYMGGEGAI